MNEVFYDIRFQTSMGNDVEITTMDIQKAVSLYNRLKDMKNFGVFKREHKIGCEDDIECDITADIADLNNQWDYILGKIQR